jgi:large conductance mechanosensitive channel
MLKEFREFAVKGNMIELAVGIIIGAAFTGVVNSLVKDLITPLIGLVWSADFKDLTLTLRQGSGGGPALTLNYGMFITTLINFVIVAFAVFMLVRAINKLRREPAPADETPPAPTEEVQLLTEIRDALKK